MADVALPPLPLKPNAALPEPYPAMVVITPGGVVAPAGGDPAVHAATDVMAATAARVRLTACRRCAVTRPALGR